MCLVAGDGEGAFGGVTIGLELGAVGGVWVGEAEEGGVDGFAEGGEEGPAIVDVAAVAGVLVIGFAGEAAAGGFHFCKEDGGFVVGGVAEVFSGDHVGVEPGATGEEGLRVFWVEVVGVLLEGGPWLDPGGGGGGPAAGVVLGGGGLIWGCEVVDEEAGGADFDAEELGVVGEEVMGVALFLFGPAGVGLGVEEAEFEGELFADF